MNDIKMLSDVDLVEQFKAGAVEAYEELLARYESKVMNLSLRFTRNQEDAEEVAQDVFVTLFRKIDGFRGQSAFSSWLHRIVVNTAFMKLRKRRQSHTISIEDLAPAVKQFCVEREAMAGLHSHTMTVSRELQDTLQRALDRLPRQYRAVFVLRDVDGLSNQETGQILGLSTPAVKSRLHRARMMLRKKLQRYYEDFTGTKFELDGANDADDTQPESNADGEVVAA
jgi:RNA polymerase sigma-70 factor (ECF subfamily)